MKLTISTNFEQVSRSLDRMREDVGARALASALNRTLEQARTAMSREIRQEFNMPAAKVSAALRVRRASFKAGRFRMEAVLESPSKRGRSLNLINFAARQTRQGVTVKIKTTGGRKVVKGAFIANKGRTVFERVPGKRMASRKWGGKHGEKIRPVQTIDVPQMFNTRRINAAVVAAMQARFPAIFERELAFALSKFNR